MGSLFSAKNREVFSTPIGMNNPVTVQVLGICSALAVTSKLEPAIVMGLSVTIITAFSNVVISLLCHRHSRLAELYHDECLHHHSECLSGRLR